MRKQAAHIYAFIFLLLAACCSCTITVNAQSSKFDVWKERDGLPQNSVNYIIQDHNGYLWIASEGGLIRFDGVKFTVYDVQKYPQLAGNRILALFEDQNKNLLIGTFKGGLSIYRNNTFTNISELADVKNSSIRQIFRDSKNRLWLTTIEKGTIVVDGNTFRQLPGFDTLKGLDIGGVYEISPEQYLVTGGRTFFLFDHGKVSVPASFQYPPDTKTQIYDSATNSFWVIAGGFLYQMANHRVAGKYAIPLGMSVINPDFRMFHIDDDKLIISLKKTYELTEFSISSATFSKPHLLNTECTTGDIKYAFKDAEHNVWYATSLCGLLKTKPNEFEYIDQRSEITNHNLYPVIRDSKNRILFGTNGGGIFVVDSNKVAQYSPKDAFDGDDFVFSIVEDKPGRYYLSSYAVGAVYKLENGKLTFVNGIRRNTVGTKAIYKSKSGKIIVGGTKGLFVIRNDSLTDDSILTNLHVTNINTIYERANNELWMTGDLSIYKYSKGHLEQFNETHGLNSKFFRGIGEDRNGNMYFGTYGLGLTVYDGHKFYILNTKNGLLEDVVSTITEDKRGNIWLTGNKGLSRIKAGEIAKFIQGKTVTVNSIIYNEDDGLISGEFNGGFQQAKCKIGDDLYLFPTTHGCVKIDFNRMAENMLAPPVHIESVRYKDSTYSPSDIFRAPYAESRLEIAFTALSYVSPKNVKFKYKLEGYDADWISVGNERKTSYTKLPPGNYTFRVTACNNEDIWNNTGDELRIQILPPFYNTWWFTLLIILFLLSLVSVGAHYFIKTVRKKEANRIAFMNVLPDLLLRMNKSGKYLEALGNERELVMPFEKFKGKYPKDILPADLAALIMDNITKALATGQLQVFNYVLTVMNGRVVDYEGRMVAVTKSEVLYIIRDVTEARKSEMALKNSQEELTNLLAQKSDLIEKNKMQQIERINAIVQTQESERTRIANELHDGIAQMLSLVKINLSAIADEKHKDAGQTIAATQQLVGSIIADLKNVSYNLMPSTLSNFGLIPGLDELADRMKYNDEIIFRFVKHVKQQSFDAKTDVNIYRIIQELINNTIKHSGATEILLQVVEHDDSIAITFENNGRRFDPVSEQKKLESRGLKNILSRVRTMNGTIQFDADNDGEIVITIEVPIQPGV